MDQKPNGGACNENAPFPSKKSESNPSSNMPLLTVFWDFQGSILEHYVDGGIMVIN
jgi:hypothetical protein